LTDLNDFEVEIEYPCAWAYTVIGVDRARMEQVVAELMGDTAYTLEYSQASRTGKYCALHLELIVETEEHRIGVFHALRGHPAIRAVM
jgi:putative lipoic acid-binding regulatory protein